MSINRRMAKGAAWMVGLKLFQRGIGLVSTIILARLLVPEDFGLVAMATVLLQLMVSVSDFSVHVLLIQKQYIDREDMDSAWTMQFTVGVVQAAILLLLAQPAADFYSEFRLVPIVQVLAGIALLKGCKNIGVVMFQRDMTFGREFTLMAIQRLATFVTTLTLALIYRSYWALVAGMVIGAFTELTLSYLMHSYRPRFCKSRCREIFGFSKWLLVNNLLGFLARRGPDLVLGRMIGPRAVGLYSVGYEISMLITTELVAPINRAALPGYSRLKETEGALQRGYLDVAGLIALVAVPAAVGLAATSDVLIPILLGAKWIDLIPVVHYLALAGAISALLTNSGTVHIALGMPWIVTIQASVRLALLLPAMLLGAQYSGVQGAAFGYLATSGITLFLNLGLVFYVLRLPVSQYIVALYRPLLSSLVMYVLLTSFLVPWLSSSPVHAEWAHAFVSVAAGILIYVICVLVLWWGAGRPRGSERRLLQMVGEFVSRRAPALRRWLIERI